MVSVPPKAFVTIMAQNGRVVAQQGKIFSFIAQQWEKGLPLEANTTVCNK